MIKVNGESQAHRVGLTVAELLAARGLRSPLLVVKVDGVLVRREAFATHRVPDGAEVQVIPLMSGG